MVDSIQCGIYSLSFTGKEGLYIGQSVNINKRYKAHIKSLATGTSNYKLQRAYNSQGLPSLSILEECRIEELDTKEQDYIKKFNTTVAGFNIQTGGSTLHSKYTKEDIICVLFMLLDLGNTQIEIADETGVALNVVRDVSAGRNHRWLGDEYPVEYDKLLHLKNIRKRSSQSLEKQGKELPRIISADGEIVLITNISLFCKERFGNSKDNSNLGAVINGRRTSHKGWRLYSG